MLTYIKYTKKRYSTFIVVYVPSCENIITTRLDMPEIKKKNLLLFR